MHEISNNVVCATSKASDQPAHILEYSMIVKLLTEHHLEFLSFKGGSRGSSEEALEARLSLHLSYYQIVEISCTGSFGELKWECY